MVCAKLFGEGLLIGSSRNGGNFEAHLCCELNTEVAQTADAEDRDDVAWPCDGLAQSVERRDARTHQRGGVDVGKVVRDPGERFCGRNHVFGVATVVGDAGYLPVLARDEVSSPARLTREIAAPEPADADAVAGLPCGDAFADGVDGARDFVAGRAGESNCPIRL